MKVFLVLMSTLSILVGVVAMWTGSLIADLGFDIAWRLGGAVCTLVGLVTGYSGLKPRIDCSPVKSEFEDFPLELLFRVQNTGLFVLTDVACKLARFKISAQVSMDPSRPTVLYTHDPEGRLQGQEIQTFSRIDPQHSQTLDIRRMAPLLPKQVDEAFVWIEITCKQRIVPLRCKQVFKYKIFKTIDGKYQWSEGSDGESELSNKTPRPVR